MAAPLQHGHSLSRKELEEVVHMATEEELMMTPRLDDVTGALVHDATAASDLSEGEFELPGMPALPNMPSFDDSLTLPPSPILTDEDNTKGKTGTYQRKGKGKNAKDIDRKGKDSKAGASSTSQGSGVKKAVEDKGEADSPQPPRLHSESNGQTGNLRAKDLAKTPQGTILSPINPQSTRKPRPIHFTHSDRHILARSSDGMALGLKTNGVGEGLPVQGGRRMQTSASQGANLSHRTSLHDDDRKSIHSNGSGSGISRQSLIVPDLAHSFRLHADSLGSNLHRSSHSGSDLLVRAGTKVSHSTLLRDTTMSMADELGLDAMRNDVMGTQDTASVMRVPQRDNELAHAMKRTTWGMLVCGILAIILAMTSIELSFWRRADEHSSTDVLKALLSIVSVIHAALVVKYRSDQRTRNHLRNIFLDTRLTYIIRQPLVVLELLVCLYHIPPGIDRIGDNGADKYNAFVILRLYTLFRVLQWQSMMNSTAGKFARLISGVQVDFVFVYKSWLFRAPFTTALASLGVSSLFLGYWVYVFERELLLDNTIKFTYWDAIYLVLITMSTVGYGDVIAISDMGRLMCVIAAVLGLTFSALMVTILNSRLHMNRKQQQVVLFLSKHELNKKLEYYAASSIQAACRVYLARRVLDSKNRYLKKEAKRIAAALARTSKDTAPTADDGGGKSARSADLDIEAGEALVDKKIGSKDTPSKGSSKKRGIDAGGTGTDGLVTKASSKSGRDLSGETAVSDTVALHASVVKAQRYLFDAQAHFVEIKRQLRQGDAIEGPVTVERVYEDVRRVGMTVDSVNGRLALLENALERLAQQTYTVAFQSDAASSTLQVTESRLSNLENKVTELSDTINSKLDALLSRTTKPDKLSKLRE